MASGYQMWCEEREVDHAHCPCGCEHPQPFILEKKGNILVCGACYFKDDAICEMVPCTPEICGE
ncbi:MAG: hypothetical protein G01um101466_218 [Parcubacteria group bacterium Gr01-1014_66]|nr:MAG: hypothetical protein G01um101466_218 [Parcubacteria group bacterium Gr01-1014_66]